MNQITEYRSKDFLARQGTDYKSLAVRLDTVSEAFEVSLQSLDDYIFYIPVQDDKWMPAEIADHIHRSYKLFASVIEDVLNDKGAFVMPKGRLSHEGKPVAQPDLRPEANRPKDRLMQDLSESYKKLKSAALKAQGYNKLDVDCMTHAFLGPLSILESLQLTAWHVRHHTKQLPG